MLEDAATNSKVRSLVEVRVEDCLRPVNTELSGDSASAEDGEGSAAQPDPPPDLVGPVSGESVVEDEARMEEGPTAAALRFPDDRSDSGVSSLRGTGSGDERSGSRSSALSGTDEPQVRHVHSVQHQTLLMSHGPPSQAPAPAAPTTAYHPPPLMHPIHLAPQPPHLYNQHMAEMLWKPSGYPHPSAAPHQVTGLRLHPDDLDRERALDRDRQERLFR